MPRGFVSYTSMIGDPYKDTVKNRRSNEIAKNISKKAANQWHKKLSHVDSYIFPRTAHDSRKITMKERDN